MDFDGQDPLEESNLRAMHRWMVDHVNDSRVIEAFGYALPSANMNESEVVAYWQAPDELLTLEQQATREYFRNEFISNNVTFVVFSLDGPITGQDSRTFVQDVRDERNEFLDELNIGDDGALLVAGFAAYSLDILDSIKENLPYALAFIFLSTIVLIFIQVRSVIIPIKAIIMNILQSLLHSVCSSLCSNGAMGLIFSTLQHSQLKLQIQSSSSLSSLDFLWTTKY